MTDHEQLGRQLSEPEVEGLLQQFFAEETPLEFQSSEPLRVTPSITEVVAQLPTSPKKSRQVAGYMALAISTICCLLVVFISPLENSEPVDAPVTANEAASSTEKTEEFVPVEEREHLRFSKLAAPEDPDSRPSETEETLAPELEVEIFPLQPDKPK